jgi:hypothetical protein
MRTGGGHGTLEEWARTPNQRRGVAVSVAFLDSVKPYCGNSHHKLRKFPHLRWPFNGFILIRLIGICYCNARTHCILRSWASLVTSWVSGPIPAKDFKPSLSVIHTSAREVGEAAC